MFSVHRLRLYIAVHPILGYYFLQTKETVNPLNVITGLCHQPLHVILFQR